MRVSVPKEEAVEPVGEERNRNGKNGKRNNDHKDVFDRGVEQVGEDFQGHSHDNRSDDDAEHERYDDKQHFESLQ